VAASLLEQAEATSVSKMPPNTTLPASQVQEQETPYLQQVQQQTWLAILPMSSLERILPLEQRQDALRLCLLSLASPLPLAQILRVQAFVLVLAQTA
jgi:hypothetical protein